MSPALYILAGIPGCGKSTWAKRFFDATRIVNTDAIREELWPGEPYDPGRNKRVFGEFYTRLGTLLEDGEVAVADATSLTCESRALLIELGNQYLADRHLVFFINTAQAWDNNFERETRWIVPEEAMNHMRNKYFDSLSAIKEEAFTSITYISGVEEPKHYDR